MHRDAVWRIGAGDGGVLCWRRASAERGAQFTAVFNLSDVQQEFEPPANQFFVLSSESAVYDGGRTMRPTFSANATAEPWETLVFSTTR